MQQLAVSLSEWFLHCVNTRVWADGLVLHAGYRTFEVPRACSGMRAAVTVLLCGLGSGILFRFRLVEMAFLLLLGLAQVLMLNVLRISGMVILSKRMSPAWADNFLHDSLGLFLLVAVFLVAIEAGAWRAYCVRKDAKAEEDGGSDGTPDIYSSRWVLLSKRIGYGILVILLLLGVVGAFYKKRPYHRAMMISGVIDELSLDDIVVAYRAYSTALALAPDEPGILTQGVKILILRRQYEDALAILDRIPRADLNVMHQVFEARALVGLKKPDEALEVIEALPNASRGQPVVSMMRAQVAAMKDDVAGIVANIESAATSVHQVDNVRKLFPYLAAHEQWEVIAKCEQPVPYNSVIEISVAIRAHLKVSEFSKAGELLRQGIEKWPDELRFLGQAAALAVARPKKEWETLFADQLGLRLERLTADELSFSIESSFLVSRPDLAWAAYRQLAKVSPNDPMLDLAPVQFGHVWFTFRKHYLGLVSASVHDTVDLTSYYLAKAQGLDVPLVDELTAEDWDLRRGAYLLKAVRRLRELDRAGELTPRMKFMYPVVLSMAGRFDQSRDRLSSLMDEFPRRRKEILFTLAKVYETSLNWPMVYETMRRHRDAGGLEQMHASMLQLTAMMHLEFGVHAFPLARTTRENFPGAEETRLIEAAMWYMYRDDEHALFLLTQKVGYMSSPLVPELLRRTERFSESARVRKVRGLDAPPVPELHEQRLIPMGAEIALNWPVPEKKPSSGAGVSVTPVAVPTATGSPFVDHLNDLKYEWKTAGWDGDLSIVERWAAIGRDDTERGIALHQLMVMFLLDDHKKAAVVAATRGTEAMPQAAYLWRARILLGGGASDTVMAAIESCPSDPEIWLAWLVTEVRRRKELGISKGSGNEDLDKWAEGVIVTVLADGQMPPGTMIRAGDFLIREGLAGSATLAARASIKTCRGLLTAYVLGIRCGVATGDVELILKCAGLAAEHALAPRQFYQLIAEIRLQKSEGDEIAIKAMEKLSALDVDNTRWVTKLSQAYLFRGDAQRVLSLLEPLMGKGDAESTVRTGVLVSEAHRREGSIGASVAILEDAYSKYPGSVVLLNNLIYNLALDQATVPRALQMLPDLLKRWPDSFVPLETAAVVYRSTGDIEKAQASLKAALETIAKTDRRWLVSFPVVVDVSVYEGEYDNMIDRGIEPFDRFRLQSVRAPLIPLAKELAATLDKIKGRTK